MMNATLRGKPDAGNPHVRFDEGEVASAKPRRGSLLYKRTLLAVCGAVALMCAAAETVPEEVRAGLARVESAGFAPGAGRFTSLAGGDVSRIDFVLTPTPSSRIRCRLALPAPSRWNGRFWSLGSGGPAGYEVDCVPRAAASGSVWGHNDMGTGRRNADGTYRMDREIITDFGHRATHLFTVEAKRIIAVYYGRAPSRSYFTGESTGGGQAMHEAIRHPGDYDGVIAGVPAFLRIPLHVYFAEKSRLRARLRATDAETKALETAGARYVRDFAYTPEKARTLVAEAAKTCPSLRDPARAKAFEAFYAPTKIGGREVHCGLPLAANPNDACGNAWMLEWYAGKVPAAEVTDDLLVKWLEEWGGVCDAADRAATRGLPRGTKVIMYGGTRDGVVPFAPMLDWYRHAAAKRGGYRGGIWDDCLFYVLPGRRHGAGGSETGVRRIRDVERVLADWVEKGTWPGVVTGERADGGSEEIPPFGGED